MGVSTLNGQRALCVPLQYLLLHFSETPINGKSETPTWEYRWCRGDANCDTDIKFDNISPQSVKENLLPPRFACVRLVHVWELLLSLVRQALEALGPFSLLFRSSELFALRSIPPMMHVWDAPANSGSGNDQRGSWGVRRLTLWRSSWRSVGRASWWSDGGPRFQVNASISSTSELRGPVCWAFNQSYSDFLCASSLSYWAVIAVFEGHPGCSPRHCWWVLKKHRNALSGAVCFNYSLSFC